MSSNQSNLYNLYREGLSVRLYFAQNAIDVSDQLIQENICIPPFSRKVVMYICKKEDYNLCSPKANKEFDGSKFKADGPFTQKKGKVYCKDHGYKLGTTHFFLPVRINRRTAGNRDEYNELTQTMARMALDVADKVKDTTNQIRISEGKLEEYKKQTKEKDEQIALLLSERDNES